MANKHMSSSHGFTSQCGIVLIELFVLSFNSAMSGSM